MIFIKKKRIIVFDAGFKLSALLCVLQKKKIVRGSINLSYTWPMNSVRN